MTRTVDEIKRIAGKIKSDPALPDRLSDTADLIGEVGLDSLEMLQFMLEVEERLAVQIDFDKLEYETLRSIQTLAAFLDTMPARPPTVGAG
jgi:acyl carrier protein